MRPRRGQGGPNKAKNLGNKPNSPLPGLIGLIRPIRPYKETGFMHSNKNSVFSEKTKKMER